MSGLYDDLQIEPYETPRGYIQPSEVALAITAVTDSFGARVDIKQPVIYLGLGVNGRPAIQYIRRQLQVQRSQLRSGRLLKLAPHIANRFLST